MPQTKVIPTATILTVLNTAISIFTFYNTGLPYILSAFIAQVVSSLNGVGYIEGQLIITATNYPQDIDFWVDSSGNLIILGDDANQYSLDGNGNIIYTY